MYSLSGVYILKIRVVSGKKGMIDDIELIIHVLFFLSLPADGAEVQHTLPTGLHILCLASENRPSQLHGG